MLSLKWDLRAGKAKATASPTRLSRLGESDPRTGLSLLFDGQEWQVTEQATYSTEEGYRVHEWCCEAGDTTAYLLKEQDTDQGTVRWFFTREIDAEAVAVDSGEALGKWLARNAEGNPPQALTSGGGTYHYADTTEGMHENDSGKRVRKVTWDYWDAAHVKNLAIERWPDGSFDSYLGAYIEPGDVTLRSAAREGSQTRARANPFLVALILLPIAYFVGFILGWPFDECMSLALPAAAVAGLLAALPQAPVAGLAALVAVPMGAAVFWYFPPLTSANGLVTLAVLPAAIGWLARRRGYAGPKLPALYAAAFGVGAPLLGMAFYTYFNLAPGPHTPDQLILALAPAVIGGVAGFLISGLVLRGSE
jgi:hypothetical protein